MKKYIRKHLLKYIFGILLAGVLWSNFSVQAAEAPSGNIEVLSNVSKESMQKYLDAFAKKYPDITVDFVYYSDYETRVQKRVESGDYGDVLFLPNFVDSSQYANYFKLLGKYTELEKKYNYMEISEHKEQLVYGIPSCAYTTGILYNQDVFYRAGISETPKSMEAFLQALRDIKDRTDAIPFYTNYVADWSLQSWEYFPYIEMTGNPDYKDNTFIKEKNPFLEGTTHYQVYELLYNIVEEGLCEENPKESSWNESRKMLNEGKIGCTVIGSWAVSQFKEAGENSDSIAFMPFPNEIDGRQYMTILTDYCYAISKNTENEAAARAYIDFMLDESGYALDHETLSIVKTDPYPDSYGDMENIILLSNTPAATGTVYRTKQALSADLNMEDPAEAQRVIEAAAGYTNESFDEIARDWNSRWERNRTPDMEVIEQEVNALSDSVLVEEYEVNFSDTEKAYLEEKQSLTVGYVKNMAPLQYEKEEGQTGLCLHICKIIEENTQLEMQFIAYDNTEQMVQALVNGEIEMIAGIDKNVEVDESILYSKDYLSFLNVVVRNQAVDAKLLAEKKRAEVTGEPNSYDDSDAAGGKEYSSFVEALAAVEHNEDDYLIMNYYSADYYTQELECSKVTILPLSEMGKLCLAFGKDVDTRLVSICNKCIYGIPEGNIQLILREYMELPEKEVTLERFVQDNPMLCIMVITAIFLLIITAVIIVMEEKDKSAKKHAMDVKRYEMLASIVDEYIFEYDYKTRKYQYDSKLQEKFGLEADVDFAHQKKENQNFAVAYEKYLAAHKIGENLSEPFLMTDKDGEEQWYKLLTRTVCDSNNAPQHIIGKLINVQKEMEEMQQMENKAQRDPLTGLYNRDGFRGRLDRLYEDMSQHLPITVVMMDFDNFKGVNDVLGHAGGDMALRLLADTLREVFEKNAIIARYGGDEFVLCVHDTSKEMVEGLLTKLVKTMDREITYGSAIRKISVSVGAVYSVAEADFDTLFARADEVLYQTKESGKNSYRLVEGV